MAVLRLVASNDGPSRTPLTIGRVEAVLDVGPSVHGFTSCRCPAHDDRWGTLMMCEVEPGDIAFHCSGGCSEESILDAVRMRLAS